MSERQEIVDAFTARLGIIDSTYGFNSNLGLNVEANRETPYDLAETLPACKIGDPEDALVQSLVSGRDEVEDRRLRLPVEIFVVEDDAEAARLLIQDIRAAIGTDETFGGLAIRTAIDEPEALDVSQYRRKVAGVLLPVDIYYRRRRWSSLVITVPAFTTGFSLGFRS